MASIFHSPPVYLPRNPTYLHFSPSILPFLSCRTPSPHLHLRALKVASDGGSVGSRDAYSPNLRRKPVISPVNDDDGSTTGASSDIPGSDVEGATGEGNMGFNQREEDEWVDWEDQILEDTVPLVGLVRMILHSGKYGSGDKLSPGHEKTILERLLPYHPEFEKKIGCGIDYIMLGYHPEFENSRCLFIARKDGELVDFSYWKCIKGLIRKNYPQYAESFILRHLRWRKRNE